MNPWTALLESLHSSLIDELTERRPETKPELGMPQRQRELSLPARDLANSLICEVTFSAERGGTGKELLGFALLALDSGCARELGLDDRGLWAALIKRAGGEFMFRGIKPRLGDVRELEAGALPAGFAEPSRVVWVPFKLAQGVCYLGVGA